MAKPKPKGMRRRRPDEVDPSSGFSDEIRAWIVVRFAEYCTPTQVADLVTKEFGIPTDRRYVNRYNPGSAAMRRKVAAKWIKLYDDARQRFLDNLTDIPMANKAARVRQLQLMYERALERGNDVRAAAYLEQIAKEVGNVHSNEHRVHHSGKLVTAEQPMSIDEMRNLLADRIAEAFEADPVKPNAPGSPSTQ